MVDTVLIADDHSLFRTGLKHLVTQLFPNPKIMEATNYDEAMEAIERETQLSLILLDLRMPQMDGFTTLGRLVQAAEGVPIVVLSGSTDTHDMKQCFERGAMGYIPKNEPSKVILRALQLVLSGGIYVPPALLKPTTETENSEENALSKLTDRQRQVLDLLAEGDSNKEIARKLNLAEATVKAHLASILRALNARNRTEAVIHLQRYLEI